MLFLYSLIRLIILYYVQSTLFGEVRNWRGRELNISVWSCSQRPSGVSNFVLTESKHWFVFRLNSINDRKKLVECSGNDVFHNKLDGHYFVYKNMDTQNIPRKSILNFKKKGEIKENDRSRQDQ